MTIINFTKKRIEAIEPSSKTLVYNDSKITGLHLRVYSSGKKVFYLYFRTQSGEQRRLQIGDATSISVETARNQARVILGEVSKGLDPVNHQRTSNLSLRNFCKIFDETSKQTCKTKYCQDISFAYFVHYSAICRQ